MSPVLRVKNEDVRFHLFLLERVMWEDLAKVLVPSVVVGLATAMYFRRKNKAEALDKMLDTLAKAKEQGFSVTKYRDEIQRFIGSEEVSAVVGASLTKVKAKFEQEVRKQWRGVFLFGAFGVFALGEALWTNWNTPAKILASSGFVWAYAAWMNYVAQRRYVTAQRHYYAMFLDWLKAKGTERVLLYALILTGKKGSEAVAKMSERAFEVFSKIHGVESELAKDLYKLACSEQPIEGLAKSVQSASDRIDEIVRESTQGDLPRSSDVTSQLSAEVQDH